MQGFANVKVELETATLDWVEYEVHVDECMDRGLLRVSDLVVVDSTDYEGRWLSYCRGVRRLLKLRGII